MDAIYSLTRDDAPFPRYLWVVYEMFCMNLDAQITLVVMDSPPLHVKKTKNMVFKHVRDFTGAKLLNKIGGQFIETVDVFKILGIWLDNELNFKVHIQKIQEKCARAVE